MDKRQIYRPKQQDDSIDLVAIFFRLLSFWYLFGIAIIIAFAGAYLFTKFNKSIYEVKTTILVDEKNKTITPEDFMGEMGLFSDNKNILNEKVLLKSYSLIRKTIDELNLYVSYYQDHNYISKQMYRSAPFIVVFDSTHVQPVGIKIYVSFKNDSTLQIEADDKGDIYHYGSEKIFFAQKDINLKQTLHFEDSIQNKIANFKIIKNPEFDYQNNINEDENYLDKEYYFTFQNPNNLTLEFKKSLKVALLEEDLTVFQLSLEGPNIPKMVNFLNCLTKVYIRNNLEKKNKTASNTVKFIDNQLSSISDSLQFAENRLEQFRSTHKIVDVSFQAQELFMQMKELENEKAILLTKMKYYKHLKKSIEKKSDIDDLIAPSTMGIDDPLLNKLVIELTELNSKLKSLSYNTKEKSQTVKTIEYKIKNAKKLLLENVDNIISTTMLSLKEVENRLYQLEQKVTKLPQTERMLFGIERKFKLNDAVYTYLLEKRAEAQIARASNIPDSEVIDAARPDVSEKISTRHRQIYLIAFLIGLILPAAGIFIVDAIRNQIITKKDIEQITDLPVLGHIIHNPHKKDIVFAEQPNSIIAESFRNIRTNLQFFSRGTNKQTILLTSSLTGEGKTFNAINLASAFALYGKKTLLMGFDFRKATIHEYFNLTNKTGITSYLINDVDFKDIIQKTEISNLDVMVSGISPPNPAELIASTATKELFDKVKKQYDCIIIDTPPVGAVTDAMLLTEFSDINIYVARQKFTSKKVFSSIIDNIKKNEINNLCILINDVKISDLMLRYGYNYGYSYHYGYEYKNKKKKAFWSKLKRT